MRTLLVGLGALLVASTTALGPARAEDSVPLRVGRVSLAEHGAGYRPTGSDWSRAAVNLPVATGSALRTGGNGGAEFRLGDTIVALAGGSEAELTRLDPHIVRIALPHGRLAVAVRTLADQDNIEIALPHGTVRLLQPGCYDIAAGSDTAPARVAVLDGGAEFVGGGIDSTIAAGSTARLDGAASIAASIEPAKPDSFDEAMQARVAEDETIASRIHLSPELAGLAELDGAGEWRAVDGYGVAWFPEAIPDGWAPYRDGVWRWVPPWGWTWVDNAGWGFAPSHYGRWARIDDRWAWFPGKAVAEPVYVPAVVAFVGTPGIGLSYADAFSPAIAWFPLGPGEVYWPGDIRDVDLIRRMNQADIADPSAIRLADNGGPPPEIVTADYQNRRFASAVPRNAFLAGQQVASALLSIPSARLNWAPLILAAPFPPAPRPVAVAAAPANAAVAAAAPRSAVVAAARAAVPALAAAAANNRTHAATRHAAAAVHVAVLRRSGVQEHSARPPAHLRVLASLSTARFPTGTAQHPAAHRHLAALHGRMR